MYATLQQYFCNDTKQSSLQAHIGLRLCALRELFEETGLLLIEDGSRANDASAAGIVLSPSETTKWHSRLRLDPAAFLLLYASIGCRPPLLSLKEWSNWMPPDEYSPRFDTMFFFVHLHSFESCATHTNPILKLTDEAYELYADEPLSFLPISLHRFIPPQAYELGRLSQFPHLNQLATFAAQRATLGCRCWRPITAEITIAGTKCKLFLLPGDQRYTDVCVAHGPLTFCLSDLALDTQRNRFVINPDCDDFWLDSTTSELGHVPPITRQVYFSLCEAT
ncbi:unnamed protein product [Dicrocoelium dendriticum]|nr:unnamed protein product [Dicrocoelium dendriticum]